MGPSGERFAYLWRSALPLLERGGRTDWPQGGPDGACKCHAPAPEIREARLALAGSVVLKLRLGQLEADQLLESGSRHSVADLRFGQRIDCGIGITDLALAGQFVAHALGKSDGATRDPGRHLAVGLGAQASGREVERDI